MCMASWRMVVSRKAAKVLGVMQATVLPAGAGALAFVRAPASGRIGENPSRGQAAVLC